MKIMKLLPCVALFTLLFISAFAYAQDQMTDHFILKITTTADTNNTDKTFTFHTQDMDYMVDWGEGDGFEPITTGNTNHTFATAGEHTIKFKNLNDIYINFGSGREKYTSIEQWGTALWNEDMNRAFYGARNLTASENAGTPNMSAVTNMSFMFNRASAFNQDIGGWDVSKVTDMNNMFFNAYAFNKDIGNWTVSKVTNMSFMFNRATNFNQDIGGWDVSKVTNMNTMFLEATNFNQDIGGWDVSKVTNMSNMFAFTTPLSPTNYDLLLNGWNAQDLKSGVSFSGGGSKYTAAAQTARDNMTTSDNWTIIDGGLISDGSVPTSIFLSSINILENEPANASVGTLSTDGGAAPYGYTLVTGDGSTDNTSFLISGAELQLIAPADFETKNSYTIRIEVDGTSIQKQFTISVVDINEALSNEDFKLSGVSISPNPTNGVLNIAAPEKAAYRLFSITGKTLKKGTLTTGKRNIDISSFAKGVYLLNIKTSKGSFTGKVIKN